MSFATTTEGDSAVIRIPQRFDFRLMGEFDKTVEVTTRHRGGEIVVDLTGTAYLDSSGLAMLLVLRDRARTVGKTVVLSCASGAVRDTLNIANFGKIFVFR